MAHSYMLTPLAIIGYFLSVMGYVGRIFEGISHNLWIVLGMILVTSGYGALLISKMRRLREEAEEEELQKKEGFSAEEAKEKLEPIRKMDLWSSEKFTTLGYGLLYAFFAGILIFPWMTFTVRYYDPFAAAGYGLAFASKFYKDIIPYYLPFGLLTLYYIMGSYIKINEEGWINLVQLISRTILAIYYGMVSLGVH